jgi:hypothetical protein
VPTINVPPGAGPLTLDDLRRNPGMLLSPSDLTRLGLFKSYSALRSACASGKLAEPYRLPGGQPRWEARAVLAAIGASPGIPAEPPLNNRGQLLPGNGLTSLHCSA